MHVCQGRWLRGVLCGTQLLQACMLWVCCVHGWSVRGGRAVWLCAVDARTLLDQGSVREVDGHAVAMHMLRAAAL